MSWAKKNPQPTEKADLEDPSTDLRDYLFRQHHSHPVHGSRLLHRRMAQHPLLQRLGIFRSDRQLLRSILYRGLLFTHVPLHCTRFTQSKGVLSGNSAQGLALAAELVPKLEVLLRPPRSLAHSAQRSDMV